jgi:hypothetical protein
MVSSVNGFWFWPATKPKVVKTRKADCLPSHMMSLGVGAENQWLIERIKQVRVGQSIAIISRWASDPI